MRRKIVGVWNRTSFVKRFDGWLRGGEGECSHDQSKFGHLLWSEFFEEIFENEEIISHRFVDYYS